MKTNLKYRRSPLMLATLAGAFALALVLFAADDAAADVKVRARLHTPIGTVHINDGYSVRYRELPRRPLPMKHYTEFRVTKHDRKVARRLSRYTGVPRHELLRMVRHGYSWREIGRWLDLPRYVVRAAQSKHAWKRFLRDDRYASCCGYDGYGDHRCDDRHQPRRGGRSRHGR